MSSDVPVIRAEGVSKSYHIYPSPRARLKQFVLPRVKASLGAEPSCYYEEFHALRDVSFEVGRGETVGIVGRNGSGKSTLLQIICGTVSPTAGRVQTRGRIAALLELGAGFNPEFTGRENVLLNGTILGMSARDIGQRFDEIAAFADIGDFMDQPIKTYSSGMVVRLAFATAIHVDPELLVIDEALSVGDVAFQQKCLNRIRRLQSQGVSILLVTHSNNALIEYCDRALYLSKGRLIMDGACRDVVKAYADDLVTAEGGQIVAHVDPVVETPVVTGGESLPTPAAPAAAVGAVMLSIVGAAVVDTTGRTCPTVERGATIRVVVRALAHERIDMPCIGVQISSVDGIVLWSATTLAMGAALPPLDEGAHEFAWELRADFGGNRYVVAVGVGVVANGEYRRTSRLDYAGHVDVMPDAAGGSGWLAPAPRVRVLPAERE